MRIRDNGVRRSWAMLFVTYETESIKSFTVADGNIDGVKETDGMMVVNADLGKGFSQGVLIMQDGDNQAKSTQGVKANQQRESTNFKYVPWAGIAKALNLPVNTDFKRNH